MPQVPWLRRCLLSVAATNLEERGNEELLCVLRLQCGLHTCLNNLAITTHDPHNDTDLDVTWRRWDIKVSIHIGRLRGRSMWIDFRFCHENVIHAEVQETISWTTAYFEAQRRPRSSIEYQ